VMGVAGSSKPWALRWLAQVRVRRATRERMV